MAEDRTVLLTGASGFLGGAVLASLEARGFRVRLAQRGAPVSAPSRETVAIGDLRGAVDWRRAVAGCSVVVHLAAIAHQRAAASDIDAVNARAPIALARAAADAGVRRLVFVSSVKAVGEDSGAAVWTEAVAPAPTTLYGRAKLEAERGILAIAGLEAIVLRPPLVHAPDARANFARLLALAAAPMAPPLGGIANRRSLIARSSLAGAIAAAALPGRATGAFFVADAPPLSTSDVVRALRRGLNRSDRLPPAPRFLSGLDALRPLFGSLAISSAAFAAAFPEAPQEDSEAALAETARAFAEARRR